MKAKMPPWIAGTLVAAVLASDAATALPIHPDATLGHTPSVVRTTPAQVHRVEGGVQRGAAVFHSFSRFDVPARTQVYFTAPAGVDTIVGRVTGHWPSRIQGTLGVLGTADLVLLNPNGIVFGPHARLDLRGSFLASTGDRLVFSDSQEFSAVQPAPPPLLRINVPIGLSLEPPTGGVIHQRGQLAVGSGQTLTLLGHTVQQSGLLRAPGGDVRVLGDRLVLAARAQVDVSSPSGGGTVLIGGEAQGQGALPRAIALTVYPGAQIRADALTRGNGGQVILWSDGVTRFAGTISAQGGVLHGNGGFVEVSGRELLDFDGRVNATAPNGAIGTLLLDPTTLEIVEAGAETDDPEQVDEFADPDLGGDSVTRLSSDLFFFTGAAITLQATQDIRFNADVFFRHGLTVEAGRDIVVNRLLFAVGNAPLDLIAGRNLIVNDIIAPGDQADVRVVASDNVFINPGGVISTSATPNGSDQSINSGDITIQTGSLWITDGGLDVRNRFGVGDPGDISIRARERVSLTNGARIISGIDPGTGGTGGTIQIHTGLLTLSGGSQISSLLSRSQIGAAGARGRAGNIQITASQRVDLSGVARDGSPSGILTSSEPGTQGSAGDIAIATPLFRSTRGARVAVDSLGTGVGGNLSIQADRLELSDRATLSAATASTQGGNIQLQVQEVLALRHGSQISAQAGANGNGGNVTIQAGFLVTVPNEDSDIIANAVAGQGGQINISTQSLLGLAERPAIPGNRTNDLDASSALGLSGTVSINRPETDPTQGLAVLPSTVVDASQYMDRGCGAGSVPASELGRFVVTGRGGLPPHPTDLLSSSTDVGGWIPMPAAVHRDGTPETPSVGTTGAIAIQSPRGEELTGADFQPYAIAEAQGWHINAAGQVVLLAPRRGIPLRLEGLTCPSPTAVR